MPELPHPPTAAYLLFTENSGMSGEKRSQTAGACELGKVDKEDKGSRVSQAEVT